MSIRNCIHKPFTKQGLLSSDKVVCCQREIEPATSRNDEIMILYHWIVPGAPWTKRPCSESGNRARWRPSRL